MVKDLCQKLGENLIKRSEEIHYWGDLSDLGNEVGIELGGLIQNMNPEQINDFIRGLEHGISLTNGTH